MVGGRVGRLGRFGTLGTLGRLGKVAKVGCEQKGWLGGGVAAARERLECVPPVL